MALVYPDEPGFWDPAVSYEDIYTLRSKQGRGVPFKLYQSQRILAAALMHCYFHKKWLAFIKPRQMGSSTLFTATATHHAAFRDGCHAFIMAHKKEVASELANMAVHFHKNMPDEVRPRNLKGKKRTLEFPDHNGRLDIASVLDDEPMRGLTKQYGVCTEVSSWNDKKGEEAWTSARNAIPEESGILVAESTPKHEDDHLHRLVKEAAEPDSKWFKVFIPWTQIEEYAINPPPGWAPRGDTRDYIDKYGISDAQAYWMATVGLPKSTYRLDKFMSEYPINEYECWLVRGESVFDATAILGRLRELDGGTGLGHEMEPFMEWEAPKEGRKYLITCDPTGSWAERDMCGIEVLDIDECAQVAEYMGHLTAFDCAKMLYELSLKYNNAPIYVEANGVGEAVLAFLISVFSCRNVYHRPGDGQRMPGWHSNKKTKAESVAFLQELIRDGSMTIRSVRLLHQLMNYRGQWDGLSGSSRDSQGGHYDLVAACCIAAWAWRREAPRKYADRQRTAKEVAAAAIDRIMRQFRTRDTGSNVTRFGKHL